MAFLRRPSKWKGLTCIFLWSFEVVVNCQYGDRNRIQIETLITTPHSHWPKKVLLVECEHSKRRVWVTVIKINTSVELWTSFLHLKTFFLNSKLIALPFRVLDFPAENQGYNNSIISVAALNFLRWQNRFPGKSVYIAIFAVPNVWHKRVFASFSRTQERRIACLLHSSLPNKIN